MNRKIPWREIFFVLTLLFIFGEILLLTSYNSYFGALKSPLIFFGGSLMVSLLPLIYYRLIQHKLPIFSWPEYYIKAILLLLIFLVGSYYFVLNVSDVFSRVTDYSKYSDIISSLEVYNQRLLKGEYPYAPFIDVFEYVLYPTYLPFFWLPFLPAEIFEFDYRWMGIVILLIGILIFFIFLLQNIRSALASVIAALLVFYFLDLLLADIDIFGLTIESLIIGIYLILGISIFWKSSASRGVGIILPLLSRFSFLFWLPLYGILIWINRGRHYALKTGAIVISLVLLIYVIPFLSQDWGSFFRGMSYYTQAAIGEWQRTTDLTGAPVQLSNGIGFAIFYYKFIDAPLIEKIQILKYSHYAFSILSVVIAAVGYYFFKSSIDWRIYSLLALKFCLTFFYAFIQVPYIYINTVPVFISIIVLSMYYYNQEGILELDEKNNAS